ncbi:MAG: carbohydrate ABC transporter permease [Spirochaetota bacterium]|uniref:carbohydrate ABC transporter permease n=1 Tax=Candidatus Jordarchaeum sp. TaxID=2823881 RepID=UPI0040492E41
MEEKKLIGKIIFVLIIILILIYTLFPLYWLLLASVKTRNDLFLIPPKFFFKPTFRHFKELFIYTTYVTGEEQATWFLLWLRNSFIEAFSGTFLAVAFGTMAGYINSRMEYKGKKDYMFFVLSTRMLPPVAIIVPLYVVMSRFRLSDTLLGMTLLYMMIGVGLSTWIMKGFFDGIPKEIEEAAFVNGYTRFQVFFKVLIPMVKGGIAATTGFCFIFAWNEFTFATIISTRYAATLPSRIVAFMGSSGFEWGKVAAAGYILIVPILVLFILIRKYILMGMTFGVLGRK